MIISDFIGEEMDGDVSLEETLQHCARPISRWYTRPLLTINRPSWNGSGWAVR